MPLPTTLSRRAALSLLLWAAGAPLASCSRAPASPAVAPTAPPAGDLFEDDPGVPIDFQTPGDWEHQGVTIENISYQSSRGGRVPGFLAIPPGTGPFPAVILLHGAPGSRYNTLADIVDLVRAGAAALAINAPFARGPDEGAKTMPFAFDAGDRAGQIQLIADLRRAVTLLEGLPAIDPARIGFVGVSYGGAMGGLFAGVEPRLRAAALVVADGGPVHYMTNLPTQGPGPRLNVDQEVLDRWVALMEPIEPMRFVGQAAPTPLLFQWGRQDPIIGEQKARELFAAASDPKTELWYPGGHELPAQARADRIAWLSQHLGLPASA